MRELSKYDAFKIVGVGLFLGTLLYIVLNIGLDVRGILVIQEQVYKHAYDDCSSKQEIPGAWM